jgi:hypothetical protein
MTVFWAIYPKTILFFSLCELEQLGWLDRSHIQVYALGGEACL